MITACEICGKSFDVLYPDLWRYKRRNMFLCSWSCLRQFDEGEKAMNKITLKQKQKAVEIAIDGGNPIAYLKSCGSSAPEKLWGYIKTVVKKKDPETFAKIPDLRRKKPEAPEAEAKPATVKVDGPIRIQTKEPEKVEVVETPEKKPELPPITAPVVYDGMIVREVEGLFGRYRYSGIGSAVYIDFESVESMDTLSYTVDQWRKFREEQDKAARILGVEL